jgi:hypothetical protein
MGVKSKKDIKLNRRIAELRREASMDRKGLERERLRSFELGKQFKETQEKIQILTAEHGNLKRDHADAEKQVSILLSRVLLTEFSIQQLETVGWNNRYDDLTIEVTERSL